MKNDLIKIKTAIEKHRWAYAEQELLKCLKAKPNDLGLLRLLRKLYWEKKDDQKAFKVAKKAYTLAPNEPMVLWCYAACMSNIYREKDAINFYKKILKKQNKTLAMHPDIRTFKRARGFRLDVQVRIGECYADIGDYEKALSYFKKYLKGKNKSVPSMYNIRTVKQYLKDCLLDYLFNTNEDNPKAFQIAKEAYASAPNDPNVLWSFAAWNNNMCKYEEAIELYKKILKKRNDTLAKHTDAETLDGAKGFKLDVFVRIADCYMSAGNYEHAIPYLERYLSGINKDIPTEYSIRKVKSYLKECEAETVG